MSLTLIGILLLAAIALWVKFKNAMFQGQKSDLEARDKDLKDAADGAQEAIDQIKKDLTKEQEDAAKENPEDFWRKN